MCPLLVKTFTGMKRKTSNDRRNETVRLSKEIRESIKNVGDDTES